jgi:hypothetical protein
MAAPPRGERDEVGRTNKLVAQFLREKDAPRNFFLVPNNVKTKKLKYAPHLFFLFHNTLPGTVFRRVVIKV